jgi:AraC-like DNA-binding protein
MLTHNELVRFCRARDRLRETDEVSLSIRDIATEAGVSPFQFIRRFESLFGETPHQFRIRSRLDLAKRLLVTGDYSVTDVCMEVGFTSLGSFSDLFARRVGVAPSVYRRQVRSIIQVPGLRRRMFHPGCLTLMGGPDGLAILEKHWTTPLVRLGL